MAWVIPVAAAVGEAAGTVGSALGSAAGAVGSTLGSAGSALGSLFGGEGAGGAVGAAEATGAAAPEVAGLVAPGSALSTLGGALQGALPETGLGSLGQGLNALFTGGSEAAPGFVGPPSALAGPAVTGPGFAGGFVQGLLGQYAPSAAPSGASAAGGGLGQLVSFLNQMHGGGPSGAPMGPIVRVGSMPMTPFTRLIPSTSQTEVEQGPIMKLLAHL